MNTDEPLLRAVENKITRRQMGNAYLEVHEKFAYGEKIMDAFTLQSLAEVLEMPMSTMEGRYARARLHRWKVDIPTRAGRPQRGFPMALLEEVIALIHTPGASVQSTSSGDTITNTPLHKGVAALVPTYFEGKEFFTITAIAEHFGVSNTTIRNKLRKAGLNRRLVNLGSSLHGGRPRRAMPASVMGDVKMAIVDGARFATELDRILANTGREREVAKAEMRAAVIPHTPPPRGSLRAWDQDTLAPVVPTRPAMASTVNTVNPSRPPFDSEQAAKELAAELEEIFGQSQPYVATSAAAPTPTKAPAVATSEDPHVIMRQAWEYQVQGLAAQAEEPTAGELRDTCEMLQLDKEAAERFVGEVEAARRTREGSQGE